MSAHASVYENTNGMPMSGGKNLHMEIGPGEIANRIITVGSVSRLEKIVKHFDNSTSSMISSSRGFTTATGTFQGVPVSCVAIGMGPAMMDFFVRESMAVLSGPVVMVRFGTCGGLAEDAHTGCVVVASEGAAYIQRNPDAFAHLSNGVSGAMVDSGASAAAPYHISSITPACAVLSGLVIAELKATLGSEHVKNGVNITADSFYSGQGRIDPNFDDQNHGIVEALTARYPQAKSMEMESFMLLHLANCSKKRVHAAAAAIVVANRRSADVVDAETLTRVESDGALALLRAIVGFTF